jgi:hypothetical protein
MIREDENFYLRRRVLTAETSWHHITPLIRTLVKHLGDQLGYLFGR